MFFDYLKLDFICFGCMEDFTRCRCVFPPFGKIECEDFIEFGSESFLEPVAA